MRRRRRRVLELPRRIVTHHEASTTRTGTLVTWEHLDCGHRRKLGAGETPGTPGLTLKPCLLCPGTPEHATPHHAAPTPGTPRPIPT